MSISLTPAEVATPVLRLCLGGIVFALDDISVPVWTARGVRRHERSCRRACVRCRRRQRRDNWVAEDSPCMPSHRLRGRAADARGAQGRPHDAEWARRFQLLGKRRTPRSRGLVVEPCGRCRAAQPPSPGLPSLTGHRRSFFCRLVPQLFIGFSRIRIFAILQFYIMITYALTIAIFKC